MKLWGGNYAGDPDRAFWEFNRSFGFDRRLLPEEIAASRAYVKALGRAGVLSAEQASQLDGGLATVLERARSEPGYMDLDEEDVHSFVETRLGELVGELASQAHVARSRNEQTVTALRLFVRSASDAIREVAARLVEALADQGEAGADAVMPGYTHTRAAEPVTFGHFAGAHAWALVRDFERLGDARRRADALPLGSGALAGTPLPLDREALAAELGFSRVSENALDAVTDRDFASELVFACAQLQIHLARLAEDLIAFSSPELGFVRLPEAYTTGSSLMPQKQNPDSLELVRGKSARVTGDLTALLALQKALPTGYQKDLQEDKEAVFDAVDTTLGSLTVMAGLVAGLGQDREAMARAANQEGMMAAGLAVELARRGMPFRKAHGRVGAFVAEARKRSVPLRVVAEEALRDDVPEVAARIDELFDPAAAVRTRKAPGGTAPEAVRASLRSAREAVRSG
jgi:argininosuccinate lyase